MRKGIFIPDITVEMVKNASLEAVEELLVSGTMEDIEIPDRPHGEWIEKPSYKEDKELGIDKQVVCSRCDEQNSNYVYGKDGRIEGKMFIRSNFCPNCGADMSASYRQVTGKLNSEIEKSKSEICPCIECCKIDNSEPCRKGCSEYQKWKEGEAE